MARSAIAEKRFQSRLGHDELQTYLRVNPRRQPKVLASPSPPPSEETFSTDGATVVFAVRMAKDKVRRPHLFRTQPGATVSQR